jgi:hypothetical protein
MRSTCRSHPDAVPNQDGYLLIAAPLYAQHGCTATLSIPLVAGGDGPADQLLALTDGAAIEQATGILITRHGCSAQDACHLLAAASEDSRLSVEEVAADLIRRAAGPDPVA